MVNMIKDSKMSKNLIRGYEITDHNSLEDLIYVMAKNVEDSLIQGGAEPGKDYTILDCYKLAQPFALEVFKERKDTKFSVSWPNN